MYKDIVETSQWSESHGANNDFAGLGAIYYALPYSLKADICVCLGSGAGFVPKLMHYAQEVLIREEIINKIDVSLVDADIGIWGRPVYQNVIDGYEGIKIYKQLTDSAFENFNNIAYLHVDADHTYEQVYKDLCNYGSRMRKENWAITVHDTNNIPAKLGNLGIGCYQAATQWAEENNYGFVNFTVGCGTALIMPRAGI